MRASPLLGWALRLGAISSLLILTLIGAFLLLRSAPFLLEVGPAALWQDDGWHPLDGAYQITALLAGTLAVTFGAVLLAAPLGVLLGLFGRYYAPPALAPVYRGLIELLAGIPSVVYGLWGLVVLVPMIANWVPPGASVLAGLLVLALMILPLMVLMVDTAIGQLPRHWVEAGQALALSRFGMIRHVVVPAIWPAIRSGAVLQTGRALGETMAVLMVCGNVVQVPGSWFEPARTLTANIALEMAYATGRHQQGLMICGLLLFLMAGALVWLSNNGRNLRHSYHG